MGATLISLARGALSLELLSTPASLPAMSDPPHMASPTATRPPISLARGVLSPMALELPSTLDMPPAMLAQPPMACPIFSMARGVPTQTPTLMLRPTMLSMASTQWVTMDQLTPTSTSTERGALTLMLMLTLMPMLMLMLMLMPIMATMAMATVTPTMVMATAMASPTGDRCLQREKERRKSCDVEF